MVRVTHEDASGRRWTVLVPAGREDEAERGIVVGPPDVGALGLPEAVAVRLHNELHARGLLDKRSMRGKRIIEEIRAAVAAAYRVDVNGVLALYEPTKGDG